MRKLIGTISFILLLLCCNIIEAQVVQPASPRNVKTKTAIDSASLQVIYETTSRNVLHVKSYSVDKQILEVGKNYNRFYSYYAELIDSLSSVGGNIYLGRKSKGYNKDGFYEDIYFNYPKKGVISVYNRFVETNFVYNEPIPNIKWEISTEKDTILNYECIKANAIFRGRKWSVWFTLDIPLNYGPWKLCGLPGLILKAEDEDKYYTYEAIGISSKPVQIEFYDIPAKKCKREYILKLNDLRWKDSNYLTKLFSQKEVISIKITEDNKAVQAQNNNSNVVIPQRELE